MVDGGLWIAEGGWWVVVGSGWWVVGDGSCVVSHGWWVVRDVGGLRVDGLAVNRLGCMEQANRQKKPHAAGGCSGNCGWTCWCASMWVMVVTSWRLWVGALVGVMGGWTGWLSANKKTVREAVRRMDPADPYKNEP
jgi:hypothetical protein